jgi:hypothetical protein
MINRYSLADHTVKIAFPNQLLAVSGTTASGNRVITLGGPGEDGISGSFVGQITVARAAETWSTEADATGSWVHNKTLDRHGTVTINIRQVSDAVIQLQMLSQAYESHDLSVGGMSIQVYSGNNLIANCDDCYIVKIPDQDYDERAKEQSWSFTAGRITYPVTTNFPDESTGN